MTKWLISRIIWMAIGAAGVWGLGVGIEVWAAQPAEKQGKFGKATAVEVAEGPVWWWR